MSAVTTYDDIVYDSRARATTHPDTLATVGTLMGMTPAPPDRCRVLELGCSTGGNLLPMAANLPASQFVGIDLSPKQIEMGQAVARSLGLGNLDLRALSILDLPESLGTFDYIFCHGVYSWVPEPVREAIMKVCRKHLSPQGIAYISYNTLPGWYQRAAVHDLLNFSIQGLTEPTQQIAHSRALLGFIDESLPEPESSYGRMMREEIKQLAENKDYYLFHEHLEGTSHPVYFRQFISHAAGHGLQYLGEAGHHPLMSAYPAEVQQTLRRLSANLIELEQYVDFLRGRTFRRTLLCSQEVTLHRAPGPTIVQGLFCSAMARPTSEQPKLESSTPEEFRNDEGDTLSTPSSLIKAALVVLFERWPALLSFEELCSLTMERLQSEQLPVNAEQASAVLARTLVQLYLSGMLSLHVHRPAFVTTPGERPLTSPLVRLQASTGAPVVGQRHKIVVLGPLERCVLSLLDGTRNREAIIDGVLAQAIAGELQMANQGQPITDPGEIRRIVTAELEGSLDRLAKSALLTG